MNKCSINPTVPRRAEQWNRKETQMEIFNGPLGDFIVPKWAMKKNTRLGGHGFETLLKHDCEGFGFVVSHYSYFVGFRNETMA